VTEPSTPPGNPGAPGLLAGVVVLDLASVGPAARCTRLLADYGATVVKVGTVPGKGVDPIRPPFFAYSGSRGWQRTAIDLKDPDGRDLFLTLVATADVVVESFRPGVIDRLGLGYQALAEVNPGIILCSTTGFGQSGPRSQWAGHDINYLAVGGYLANSEPAGDDGPPVAGATIADAAGGGLQAAMAVMAALIGRQASGVGTSRSEPSNPSSTPTSAGSWDASSGSITNGTTTSRGRSGTTLRPPSPPVPVMSGWRCWRGPTPAPPRC